MVIVASSLFLRSDRPGSSCIGISHFIIESTFFERTGNQQHSDSSHNKSAQTEFSFEYDESTFAEMTNACKHSVRFEQSSCNDPSIILLEKSSTLMTTDLMHSIFARSGMMIISQLFQNSIWFIKSNTGQHSGSFSLSISKESSAVADDQDQNTGLSAGNVIGLIVLLLIIALISYLLLHWRRKVKRPWTGEDEETINECSML
jgi:hypothetical protein